MSFFAGRYASAAATILATPGAARYHADSSGSLRKSIPRTSDRSSKDNFLFIEGAPRLLMLVRQLREIQQRVGYLPKDEIERLSARLDVPLHRIHEVISFFPHFRREPPPDVGVHVCRDIACHLREMPGCLAELTAAAAEFGGESCVKVESVSCLGRCDGAPAVLIELQRAGQPEQIRLLQRPAVADYQVRLRAIVAAHLEGRELPPEQADREPRPWRIDPYHRATNGAGSGSRLYDAARKIAEKLKAAAVDPERQAVRAGVISELEQANLRGMGGAGTPAAQKWRDVLEARGDAKYIVCNADESEPATFKDRELRLRTPDLIIEGMVLAALLFRAKYGYIYIRHEYHEQIEAVNEGLNRPVDGEFSVPTFWAQDCRSTSRFSRAREAMSAESRGRSSRRSKSAGPSRATAHPSSRPTASSTSPRCFQMSKPSPGFPRSSKTAASGTLTPVAKEGRGMRPRASPAPRACASFRSAATSSGPASTKSRSARPWES